MGNKEWTIQRNWQHWAHKTHESGFIQCFVDQIYIIRLQLIIVVRHECSAGITKLLTTIEFVNFILDFIFCTSIKFD